MTVEEELKLVKDAQEDIRAFNELYKYYFPKIYKYCIYRIPNHEIAEDITSQVFIDSVEKLHKFKPQKGARFGSWLYRIAHNKIIDRFRSSANKDFYEYDDLKSESHDENLSVPEKEETSKKVHNVINSLNPRYQEVLILRFVEDMSIDEISEILDTNNKNVSVLLHRSLKAFKKKYEIKYPECEILLLE